ncbi:hypothetical protein ACLBX9_30915 [Methylobacterium sp. A49B]
MTRVNQNTAATDGKSFPETGRKLPNAPNGGGTPPFRTGDSILHKPSGDTWVWADPATGYLSWLGWPPGEAKISDFKLAKAATDEEHRERLRDLKQSGGSIAARALRLYGDPVEAAVLREPRFGEGRHG